ncbi:hypothetical protein VPH35_010518 [Triticum aestivum]
MGMLALNRLLPVRQDRRRRKTQSRSMSIASLSGKKSSIGHPQGGKTRRCPGPDLPQGIWDDILALLPLQDAVRAGCVSHTLLSSWRCRPDLTFSNETLGLDGNVYGSNKLARVLAKRVDRIMKKHSGIGVKKFELHYGGSSLKSSYLDRWLRIAVAPGIEEVILLVPGQPNETYHNFPCSLLSNGSGSSIQHLRLTSCAFHPVAGFGCLRRLHLDEGHDNGYRGARARLELSEVDITGDELWRLLSNSLAMEELDLNNCDKITSLKIPCQLDRLNSLSVSSCFALKAVENKAPNLCNVQIDGNLVQLILGYTWQVKDLEVLDSSKRNLVRYACVDLPYIMPNLEALYVSSVGEDFSTPILHGKFHCLKNLEIDFDHEGQGGFSPGYDYFFLVSFLDACPLVETFVLGVSQRNVEHELISEDSVLRRMPGHHHDNIKDVTIIGFCAAKSMVELTCHILENATSLECLTLDAVYDNGIEEDDRSCVNKSYKCSPQIGKRMIAQAHKGLWAIGRYVADKVPSTVKSTVKNLCERCHAME